MQCLTNFLVGSTTSYHYGKGSISQRSICSVCKCLKAKDQAIYERFPLKEGRPKMHSSVLVTGTMTKSMLRGGVHYISKGLTVPCIRGSNK